MSERPTEEEFLLWWLAPATKAPPEYTLDRTEQFALDAARHFSAKAAEETREKCRRIVIAKMREISELEKKEGRGIAFNAHRILNSIDEAIRAGGKGGVCKAMQKARDKVGKDIPIEDLARDYLRKEKLWLLCEEFIEDNHISCGETIYQCDWVVEHSLKFIEKIAEIVGFYSEAEDGC